MNEKDREERARGLWEKIHARIEALAESKEGEMTADELTDLWYRRALELSRVPDEAEQQGDFMKLVTFKLDRDRYGVAIDMVREIQRAEGVTTVPTAPDFVVGVMNLRGSILSIVDIRIFFGLPPVTIGPAARILLVESDELRVGLLVEHVNEIAQINTADIQPPLSPGEGITEDYIRGIVKHRGEMLIVVDLKKILENPRLLVEEKV